MMFDGILVFVIVVVSIVDYFMTQKQLKLWKAEFFKLSETQIRVFKTLVKRNKRLQRQNEKLRARLAHVALRNTPSV